MSTRCYIGKKNGKKVKFIYCHHDGYPDGVGDVLLNHYKQASVVDAMIEEGDRTALGENYLEGSYTSFGENYEDNAPSTVDYDSWISMIENKETDCEYFYLFDDDEMWKCWNYYGREINLYDE